MDTVFLFSDRPVLYLYISKIGWDLCTGKIADDTMKPVRYHHGDLREALLEAALRTLEAESHQAVTLRRLAREAGVSHAAPYHHFRDLDALLAAVAARGFHMLRDEMTGGAAGAETDPFRRLQAAGIAYVKFAVVRPELFRLMFSGRWRESAVYPELQEAEHLAFAALQEMMAGAMGKGEKSSPGVTAAARAAWALVHGTAMLLVDGRIDAQPNTEQVELAEQLTREVTTVLGKGLRSLQASTP